MPKAHGNKRLIGYKGKIDFCCFESGKQLKDRFIEIDTDRWGSQLAKIRVEIKGIF